MLRLVSLNDSLFGDELSTYYIVTDHSVGRVVDLLDGDSVDLNPPLAFVVAWGFDQLGDSAQLLRLGSLTAGTAAIPLTYVLGLWTVGRGAALIAAALVSLSPFLIFYSTEARAYGLVLALVLCSTLALLQALRTERLIWWIAYAAASCAAVWTHYPPLFLLIAQFAWAFWTRPEARRALLLANAAAAAGYIPWLPTLLDNTDSPGAKVIALLNPFDLHSIRVDLGRWSIGHPYLPLRSMPGTVAVAMLAGGLGAALVGLAVRIGGTRLRRPQLSSELVLVIVLALGTPVGLLLYSLVGDSVWDARNLIASWPGLALAAAALLMGGDGLVRVLAITLVVGSFAIGGVTMLKEGSQRPAYEAAASYIERVGAAGDPVVEVPAPTPGPLAPLGDVALAQPTDAGRKARPALRLGAPRLERALRARPYEPLPIPDAHSIAREAGRLAVSGRLFIVAPGDGDIADLGTPAGATAKTVGLEPALGDGPPLTLVTAALAPLPAFLAALPDRFSHVATRTFPGFMPVSVYVFRDRPGERVAAAPQYDPTPGQ